MQKFGQETPNAPCIPSLEVRRLRAKLILEEALETVRALGIRASVLNVPSGRGLACLMHEDNQIVCEEAYYEPNLEAIADGCADLRVVTIGTEVVCGIPGDKTFAEVMRSNDGKLWSDSDVMREFNFELEKLPEWQRGQVNHVRDSDKVAIYIGDGQWLVKDKDGKVVKPESYSPANLKPLLKPANQN